MRSAHQAFLDGEGDGEDDDQQHQQVTMEDEELVERKESDRGEEEVQIITPGAAASNKRSAAASSSSTSRRPRTHGSSSSHPSSSSLDPAVALQLTRSSATILLLDLPVRTQFGVDYWSFVVGEKFKGMKMIPKGVHYIWTAISPDITQTGMQMMSPDMVPRLGTFVWFDSNEVFIRRWSETQEMLVTLDEDEEARYAAGVRRMDFDSGLGSYPLNNISKWHELTNYITKELVLRLEPVDKWIGMTIPQTGLRQDRQEKKQEKAEGDAMTDTDSTATIESATAAPTTSAAPSSTAPPVASLSASTSRFASRASASFYTRIPTISSFMSSQNTESLPLDAARKAQMLTQLHMDQTQLLDNVLQMIGMTHAATSSSLAATSSTATPSPSTSDVLLTPAERDLLGEYQFSFVAFLIGQDYEAFEQWKSLTILLTSCQDALNSHHVLYEAWLSVLGVQMTSLPKDFFVDHLSHENFMLPCLQRLFQAASEEDLVIPQSLVYTLAELSEFLKKKFMWKVKQLVPIIKAREERSEGAATITSNEISEEEIRAFREKLKQEAEDDEYAPTIADD